MPDSSTVVFFAGLSVAVFAAKYFLSSGSSAGSSANASAVAPEQRRGAPEPRTVTDDMVSVVSVLVPHIDHEVIRQDLEETHSVQETSTRLLNRSQEKKPQTASANSLLSRYNVEESSTSTGSSKPESPEWIDDRKQREEHMLKQRQQMILKARQRTMELEQQKQQQS